MKIDDNSVAVTTDIERGNRIAEIITLNVPTKALAEKLLNGLIRMEKLAEPYSIRTLRSRSGVSVSSIQLYEDWIFLMTKQVKREVLKYATGINSIKSNIDGMEAYCIEFNSEEEKEKRNNPNQDTLTHTIDTTNCGHKSVPITLSLSSSAVTYINEEYGISRFIVEKITSTLGFNTNNDDALDDMAILNMMERLTKPIQWMPLWHCVEKSRTPFTIEKDPKDIFVTDVALEHATVGINLTEIQTKEMKPLIALRNIIGASLKIKHVLKRQTSVSRIKKLGTHVLNVYAMTKEGKGTIPKDNQSVRYLYLDDNESIGAKLFSKSGSYKVGREAKTYTSTDEMDEVMEYALDLFSKLEFSEYLPDKKSSEYFDLPSDILKSIKIGDAIFMLSRCIGYKDGYFKIALNESDNQNSRVYNTFTSIGSHTRKALGFINYDIQTAMQTISLQILLHGRADEIKLKNKYPEHFALIANRTDYRNELAKEAGWTYDEVKTALSSIDNGGSGGVNYQTNGDMKIWQYKEEAKPLMQEVIKLCDRDKYAIAWGYARTRWDKTDGKNVELANERNTASLYFFIWTQYEREIRHTMKSCFSEQVVEVHDAVYSKELIDTALIEKAVLENVGFKVKIDRD